MAEGARSHYTILGVAERASAAEIRVAYLNLARALHPDRQQGRSPAERSLAERRMREVNDAYAVVGDAARRREYDAANRPTAAPRSTAAPRTPPRAPARAPARAPDDDPFDDEPHFGHQSWMDEDDVELSPLVAFLLRRGPLIAVLFVAAVLFIGTAYAGTGNVDPATTTTTSAQCSPDVVTGVSSGSVVPEPC